MKKKCIEPSPEFLKKMMLSNKSFSGGRRSGKEDSKKSKRSIFSKMKDENESD